MIHGKKNLTVITVVAFILFILGSFQLLVSCKKRDLAVTEILPQSCRDCHGSEPKYALLSAKAGYDLSGHNRNGNAFYANGDGCQRCHTNEGFVEFVKTGKVDETGFVTDPSQPSCFTCHDPHGTGNFSLRVSEPVVLANGEQFSGGKGNLCAACHQSRSDAGAVVVVMEASKVSSRFGPHYGPQGDLFAGTNAYEFPGKTYANSPHTEIITDSCVSCHKTLPEKRFSLSPGVAGHSFNIEGEVHEQPVLNTAGCLGCHPDIKQATGNLVFDKKATEDYDLDGKIEPFQLEVRGLLDKFLNSEGTGYLQTIDPAFYDKNGRWQNVKEGERTVEQMAALFNYVFFVEDRSLGIHNPKYAIQILYDTIDSLDPSFNVSYRP